MTYKYKDSWSKTHFQDQGLYFLSDLTLEERMKHAVQEKWINTSIKLGNTTYT